LKKIIFILIVLFVKVGILYAQPEARSGADMQDGKGIPGGEKKNGPSKQDSIQPKIRTWKLYENFNGIEPKSIDTLTINFHCYDPVYRKSISNTTLGYVGSPYQSNDFFERKSLSDFYFLRNLDVYATQVFDVNYYNTTTPFSYLRYVQNAGDNNYPEQQFDAFFTQNIDPNTNFGFKFDVIKMDGQYKNQGAHHKNLNLFLSRNTERYNGYFTLVKGNYKIDENGGIEGNTINTSVAPYELDINLVDGITTEITSFSVLTSHEYLMGKKVPKIEKDSTTTIHFKPHYSAQYIAGFESYKRTLTEASVDTVFFANTYISKTDDHADSLYFRRFYHMAQLKMLENADRRFTFGKMAFIDNEIVSAIHPVPYGSRKYTYSNVSVGAEIYSQKGNFLKWRANGRMVLLGRNLGDATLRGMIEKPLYIANDTTTLSVEGWYSDKSPDIFQEHSYSNHFKWENNFRKQHEVVVRGKLDVPSLKLVGGANYALLSNYLYNGEDIMPKQYQNEFLVLNVWAKKDLHFWRFGWENAVEWQKVSDQTVLHLPEWSALSRIYYSHVLFKVMKIQLGGEVYYNTKFKADKYDPATSMFYLQNEKEIGGFPIVNVFMDAKLKRTSAFVRMMHVNSSFNGDNFFMSPSYPLSQSALRFGFLWSFYN
jgi:hypothetical protein